MAKSVVGLDLGRRAVRAVEIENPGRARPVIVRSHEVPLPEGAVTMGDVREVNTVASAVRRLWSEGGFKTKDVVLGIGNQRVITRDLVMPKLPTLQHIREALPFQVQDMLPVPVGEALLDYYPISESSTDRGQVNGILIAAIKESVLANVRAVQSAGLTPVNVDLVPFALVRANVRGPLAQATVVMIDVGATTTNVVVTSQGVPQFVRMIPGGGDDITRAVMNRLEIAPNDAESFKAARGLNPAPPSSELERAGAEAILSSTHELLNSLRNTLQYYASSRPGLPPQVIALSGGGARMPGFAQALGESMRLQVMAPSIAENFELGRAVQKLDRAQLDGMTVAMGLATGVAA